MPIKTQLPDFPRSGCKAISGKREREKANKLATAATDGAHKPPGPKSQCKQWPATLATATMYFLHYWFPF